VLMGQVGRERLTVGRQYGHESRWEEECDVQSQPRLRNCFLPQKPEPFGQIEATRGCLRCWKRSGVHLMLGRATSSPRSRYTTNVRQRQTANLSSRCLTSHVSRLPLLLSLPLPSHSHSRSPVSQKGIIQLQKLDD
jgi:hypothetical protein